MSLVANYSQLSRLEQADIKQAVDADLVEHLYKGAPPGVGISFFSSAAIFAFLYNQQNNVNNQVLLIGWLITFYASLISIAVLYYFYNKFRHEYKSTLWEVGISIFLALCTVLWGVTVLFLPETIVNQFILFAILFMVAASFSMATVGNFLLCVICQFFVLIPVALFFFLEESFYYKIGGFVILLYFVFLLGMNRKSTDLLRDSLMLSRILVSVSHSATHDLLTDLKNLRLLTKSIENFIEICSKTTESFALICFSVNRLERLNISLGFQAGDLIIQSLAKRLEAKIKELQDLDGIERILTLPRQDAFVILMKPINLAGLDTQVRQLFKVLETPFHLGKREATLTASIGISVYPNNGDNAKALLNGVYTAMFQAKQSGGNQIEYYKQETNKLSPSLLELENDLHHAIEHKELLLYYQPIIDLSTRKLVGMEALIRWKHPKRGMIYPLDFIHLAEETRLIIPIGKWVLEQACRQTVQWQKSGLDTLGLKVSINLSPKQLQEPDFIGVIDSALQSSGLDPCYLDLELTETEILNENLIDLFKEINKKGITLSIDDFGTGYSGLSYLKHFDVDRIKIDKSFIQDVQNNNDSATIVSAILAMAKEMNIKTLAEGVETVEQLEFLIEKNCNFVQGYYFSKPIAADEFAQYIKKNIDGVSV